MDAAEGGGFMTDGSEFGRSATAHGLLSPAASSWTVDSSSNRSELPSPRQRPLRSGSAKESAFINYLDDKIRRIQRKFGLRVVDFATSGVINGTTEVFDSGLQNDIRDENNDAMHPGDSSSNVWNSTTTQENSSSSGYRSFVNAAADISRLVSIVWVSGTPSLQIPYLLSLALLVATYIPAFPAAPKSMFNVLQKLDYVFASLVQGRDLDTGEVLPGFWGSANEDTGLSGVDETTKVRIRSLVERTRVVVVDVMSNHNDYDLQKELQEANESTDEDMNGIDGENYESDDWDMAIARVYDRTLVELGGTLGVHDGAMLTSD